MKPWVRIFLAFFMLLAPASTIATAQSPFQFREAYFLERRLKGIGKDYDPGHPEHLFHTGPDLSEQTRIDTRVVTSYADYRSLGPIVSSIADIRRRGGIQVAEARYLECVEMIRRAQGPDSSDEALILDWIGEFYLELRDFDRAYLKFSEALRVARIVVEKAKNDPDDSRRALPQFGPGRLHLADVLTRLGQLDLARGDLAAASAKLEEAIEIDNKAAYLTFENRLDAIYFKSLVLEKQEKWQEAEALWRDAIARRETVGNEPYWDARKELAAMFARHGDFHSAAKEANAIVAGTANQQLHRAKTGMYWLNIRGSFDTWSIYEDESNRAMQDILAVDRWVTEGPNVAAPLVGNPVHASIDEGSDADILRLHSWTEKKVFLKMSILLDGTPTRERVAQAYGWLSEVKGRYLAMHADLSRQMDENILNPGVSGAKVYLPQELAEANERYANTFLSLALDNHAVTPEQLRQSVSTEQTIQEAASARCLLMGCAYEGTSSYKLAADAAVVDFTAWNRLDRSHPARSTLEYGAFVQREGRPIVYVRLGAGEDIDKLLGELELGVDGFFQSRSDNPEEIRHTLQNLYSLVLAPMESALQGVNRLLVIPDGRLSMVPLGGLIDRQGHYFLERHAVIYFNSKIPVSQSGPASAPVVVANPDFDLTLPGSPQSLSRSTLTFKPLPGAEREARYIAETLRVPTDRVLIGRNAREQLLHSIRSPEILHLATHSDPFLRARLPADQFPSYDLFEFPSLLLAQEPFLHSAIALAGANRPQAGPEDGLLTGLEVASLHLAGTRLVVLSSCQSANGKLVDGQGIPGLRAAFSAAGARSLLMNLWPVDDEAGFQFMQFFYSHLELGFEEAMRQAQLHMLNDTRYKNPLFWAGYTYSDNEALIPDTSSPKPSAPAPVVKTAKTPGTEAPIAPRCFQLSGASDTYSGIDLRFTARIRLAAARAMRTSSDNTLVYDLSLPGNEITIIPEVNGKPADGGISAGGVEKPFAEKTLLVMTREANRSVFALVIGKSQRPNGIALQGPPDLFPTFDVPESLPSLRSYREAFIQLRGEQAKVDTVGACSPEPPGPNLSVEAVAPAVAAVSDLQADAEMLIAPRCFELSGVSNTSPGLTTRFTARITLGGVVRKLLRAEQLAIYDIHLPGNEVAIVYDINGTQTSDSYHLSQRDGLTLTMRRTSAGSSLSVRTAYGDSTTEWVVMEGPPDLFPTVDIPEMLPSLSPSTQALVQRSRADAIGFCGPGPLVRYDDGKIRINPFVPPEATGGGTNSATAPVHGTGSKGADSVIGTETKGGTGIPSSDQNSVIARQILAYALLGDSQSVFKHLTSEADKTAVGAMVAFLSGAANELGHCPVEGTEVHKILWADKSGRTAPAYVAIGNCEKARPRLLLFMADNGVVSRTGRGWIISKSTSDQIERKAQSLAESLLRGDVVAFARDFSPALPAQFQNVPAIVNSAIQDLGSFEKIVVSKKFPYADIVVVTALYQRGAVNVEISFDPSLRIASWYAQNASKPGYFWQEFRDLQ